MTDKPKDTPSDLVDTTNIPFEVEANFIYEPILEQKARLNRLQKMRQKIEALEKDAELIPKRRKRLAALKASYSEMEQGQDLDCVYYVQETSGFLLDDDIQWNKFVIRYFVVLRRLSKNLNRALVLSFIFILLYGITVFVLNRLGYTSSSMLNVESKLFWSALQLWAVIYIAYYLRAYVIAYYSLKQEINTWHVLRKNIMQSKPWDWVVFLLILTITTHCILWFCGY